MKLKNTAIDGVAVIEFSPSRDGRGEFTRLFCMSELADIVGDRRIVQINRSQTNAVGAIRGLHYQRPPFAEMKLVTCLQGGVWDVAVDLRAGSPTFLKWHSEKLLSENPRMIVIPEGCAHGFQVLAANSELLYMHTAFYNFEAEAAVNATDPRLKLPWPLPITDISIRDQNHPLISADFEGVVV